MGETNSNIKGSNDKNNLYIAIPAMFFVWIILILVIRYCLSTGLKVVSPSTLLRTVSLSNGLSNHFVFRPILYDQACFGFKNALSNKAEPMISDLAQRTRFSHIE